MEYRVLGRTGEKISAVSLGAEHLNEKTYETVDSVISESIEQGINYIDIFMPQGQVRTDIGNALRGRREKVMVAGHIGAALTPDGQYLRTREPAKSQEFLEDFIRRVGGERIDMLMIHYVDEMEDAQKVLSPGGQLEMALKMKREGKIRFIGLSSHVPSVARHLVETDELDAVMFPVNPLHDTLGNDDIFEDASYANVTQGRSRERSDFYAACQRHGTGIIAMKTYAAGRLLTGESALGMNMSHVQCIHYALSQPSVCSAAIGCQTAGEVRAAMEYFSATSMQRDFTAIHEAKIYSAQKAACMYCNHCLPCEAGIDIAAVTRLLDATTDNVNERLAKSYGELNVKPSLCVGCGGCVERCPFGVDAMTNMKTAAELFSGR